jgi:hypothetical protein
MFPGAFDNYSFHHTVIVSVIGLVVNGSIPTLYIFSR